MNSPIPWMGGKRRLAKHILPHLPDHTCYVEPFAGGAAILFMREEPAKVEVLNDLDGELVNFYRVAKHHLLEFCNQFRWAITSRQMFEWLKITPTETMTDIQRAARFYYLQKLTFGGKSEGRAFGTATTARPKLNLVRLEEDMSATHERLAHVMIEHLSWDKCVEKYDRPHTLFFLDPPYWKTAGYTGPALTLDDYRLLADKMATIQGKAILTINDHPDMVATFGHFRRDKVAIKYTVGGGNKGAKKAGEMICYNWD
ncbi:MAG TPA: DNA adenine methylase [Acidiferrobacteraceae bacterium]|nr:DNA adenine methylase [Acidiferrobacteraceae bacterium]